MVGLHRWLEAATADNLYLATQWVRDRAKETDPAVKRASAKSWSGTYDDNGSCLDVATIADPSADTRLRVLQSHPLILTDGAVSIWASLTSACKADLHARYPNRRESPTTPNTTFTIRHYTLRLTTYGLLQGQITLLVHQVDWLDAQPASCSDTVLVPIHEIATIAPTWQKFCQARLEADRRCFLLDSDTDPIMAPSRSAPDEQRAARASSPGSQLPFGTQAAHPLRHQTKSPPRNAPRRQAEWHQNDAGNRRPEASEAPSMDQMLSLLSRPKVNSSVPQNPSRASPPAPVAPSVGGSKHSPPANVQADFTNAAPLSRAPISPNQPARSPDEPRNDTPRARALSRPGLADPTSSELAEDELDDPEPAWLKDCRPTCGCTNVSQKQRTLLSRPESWFKPDAGLRYPHANMPIEISKALLEKHATANAQVDASSSVASNDDEEDEEDEDENEDLPGAIPMEDSNNEADADMDEEMPTSPVPWSSSPVRDPPRRPPLPPDSSFEAVQNFKAQDTSDSLVDAEKPEPLGVALANETLGPPSSPPDIQQDQDSNDEMELELPRGLIDTPLHVLSRPSSAVQVKEIPHTEPTSGMLQSSTGPQASSRESKHASPTPIVHCTYKGQQSSGEHNIPGTGPDEAASALLPLPQRIMAKDDLLAPASKPLQSPSMGSVDLEMSDAPSELPQGATMRPQSHNISTNSLDHTIVSAQPEPSPISAQQPAIDSSSSGHEPASTNQNQGQSTEQSGGISRGLPTKRKLEKSLTKTSHRVTKRREIKIVGFGDSPVRDPAGELRQAKNQSLARFQQERRLASEDVTMSDDEESGLEQLYPNSNDTNANLRRSSQADQESQIGPSFTHGGIKGPTHDRPFTTHERVALQDCISSYHPFQEPARNRQIASTTHEAQLSTKRTDAYVVEGHPVRSLQVVESASPIANQGDLAAPRHLSIMAHNGPSLSSTNASRACKSFETVFQCFKATYPEYTGSVQHFIGQCKQIHKLDLEDKMVAKWQWDDFIIRNRTDYKNYILQCGDNGEDPEPYHRYYKDNIRNTLYDKGVVNSSSVLLTALKELDVLPQETAIGTADTRAAASSASPIAPEPPIATGQPNKQGRKSLPWAPIPSIDSSRDHARYSLPTSAQGTLSKLRDRSPSRRTTFHNIPTSASSIAHVARQSANRSGTSTPTSSKNLNGSALGQPVDASKIPTEPTGDEYRDFFFAWSRATSFTGSTEIDPTKPWPENLAVRRKAEVPRPNGYDVLDWKDEL